MRGQNNHGYGRGASATRSGDRRARRQPGSRIRLFEADPDLLGEVPAGAAEHLRRQVTASEAVFVHGGWSPGSPVSHDGVVALLLLDGFLIRRMTVLNAPAMELLAAGDVFSPAEPELPDSVYCEVSWRPLTDGRLAVIDDEVMGMLAPFPQVLSQLAGRSHERARSLTLQLAFARLRRVSARLHVLFWHLADRFGRREGGVTIVPLVLPAAVLAGLVSAHRQSTVAALKELGQEGLISRRVDGCWVLHGAPPRGARGSKKGELGTGPGEPLASEAMSIDGHVRRGTCP